MPDTPDPTPGQRQPKETAVAFEAFRAYLEMGPSRSVAKVGQALGKSKTLIDRWSSRWDWVERVRAVESSDATAIDSARAAVLAEAAKRQAQQAQLHSAAQTLISSSFVQRISDNPELLKELPIADHARLVPTSARGHNRSVTTERLALGMTTDQPGEAMPRERAAEMAARLTDEELDARLGVVDELAAKRERRDLRRGEETG